MTEFLFNHPPSCNFQLVIMRELLGCIDLSSMEIAMSSTMKLTAMLHFHIFTDASCFIFTVFDLKFLFPFMSFRKPFCLCLAYYVVSGRQLPDWTLHSAGNHLCRQATDSKQCRWHFSSVSMKCFALKYYFMKIAVSFSLIEYSWLETSVINADLFAFQRNNGRGSYHAIRGSWVHSDLEHIVRP